MALGRAAAAAANPTENNAPSRNYAGWLLYEFGLVSLYTTGRDAWLIIAARTLRMFAFGGASLVMALFFAALGFTDTRIGLFMTLTLAGGVLLSFVLTMIADGVGKRRILFAGGALMALSGAAFSYFENFWVLVLAAVLGVISTTGGDFGPFRAIEESALSQLTTPKTRSDVLAWYVTVSGVGSALGIEVTGRVVEALKTREGWDDVRVYHSVFFIYIICGAANMIMTVLMSNKCELADESAATERDDDGSQLAQGLLEESDGDDDDDDDKDNAQHAAGSAHLSTAPSQAAASRLPRWFPRISASSLPVMYKLWFLLSIDCIADGMVSYTLTSYYMDNKFHKSKSTLGDVLSANFLLGALSTIFASPLSRHLGLVNTMVFTHLPSSVAVLLFPAPQSWILTVVLLFIRGSLNNMDQAPRVALIAAVVKPEERTAIMAITSTLRILASTVGPVITGVLAESDRFWIAFVVAGSLRIAYDLGLWVMFVNLKLYAHESSEPDVHEARRVHDEEGSLELDIIEQRGSVDELQQVRK